MRTVSLRLTDLIKTVIPIGFVGENLHTKVFIDCKIAFDEYPTATVAMTVKPPKGDAYPAVVSRNGDIVTWDVSDSDLLYEGNGELQLAFVVDEVIAKSYIGRTRIQRSIIPTGEIPTPIEDWITKADEILDSIPGQINSALEEAKESGEFDGDDGVSPEVSVEEITGGHQVSITDAEGTSTFDVMDGAPGDPGAPGAPGPGVSRGGTTGQVLKKRSNADYDTEWAEEAGGVQIDDSAGIGDTGVTWSANKSATELSKKADKVSNATSGDFAGLDSNGNLTDSGSKASDFIASSLKGSNNGVAELDASGRVPSSQLPSYVDDVEEYSSLSAFPATGESGKIYIALDTNRTYRWSGSSYVAISSDLALGETSSTAYRGDRGAAAYAASVTNVESAPVSGSSNLITSGAVYTGLEGKADKTDTVLLTTLSMGRKANTTVGQKSVAVGSNAEASGYASHAEGENTNAEGSVSHAEGQGGTYSAQGNDIVSGAKGVADHTEGYQTLTSDSGSPGKHAEGYQTQATGGSSHAEGYVTIASGYDSHSEGYYTTASGNYGSHAEGGYSEASGDYSHAEGSSTKSVGSSSHAEGSITEASGPMSHAEGYVTHAIGESSHAEGYETYAIGLVEHVSGQYNVKDSAPAWVSGTNYSVGDLVSKEVSIENYDGDEIGTRTVIYRCNTNNSDVEFDALHWDEYGQYLEVVGNGTTESLRSNARALDWDGNERLKGNLYVGCNADSTGGVRVLTENDAPEFATVEETQQIISAYEEEEEENVIVEMSYDDNSWTSVMDATDIGALIESGKSVTLHIPSGDGNPDAYLPIVYYAPANENYEHPCFRFADMISSVGHQYDFRDGMNDVIFITNDGKLNISWAD